MDTISATELARNTSDILHKVTSRGQTLGIYRNNALIAQLSPPTRSMTASQILAGIKLSVLSPKESDEWLKTSRHSFDESVANPWE